MTSNLFYSDHHAQIVNDAGKARFNSGLLKVYAGSQPTDANTSIGAQTLLGTFTFASTAFGASSASGTTPSRVSSATAAAISDVTAAGTGTATWFRAFESDGTTVIGDGSAGLTGCDLNLTDVSITAGETMSVASFTYATPE